MKKLLLKLFNKKKYHNYIILNWIKKAKNNYLNNYCDGMCSSFLCSIPKCFFKELCNLYDLDGSLKIQHFIPEYYPEFFGTYENDEGYWWKHADKVSRIKAFNKLIEIYEEKCAQ